MEFKGTITIETDRLILRKFQSGDESQMFKNYCNDARVCEYLSWLPHKSESDTLMFLNACCLDKYDTGLTYKWAIVWKENNEVIGSIDVVDIQMGKLKAVLGYVLGYNYWGNGIMPEAAKAVLEHLFSEGFKRIEAWHNVANPKSGRVMQKIGMTHEGTLKSYDMDNQGVLRDMELYAIVKN